MLKGEKRRQEILSSAEDLFYKQGYEKTTIEDILAVIGCSKGSFYHHFESKMQVLEEIAAAHISSSFEQYQQEAGKHPLERLNDLLYFAAPFREKEEKHLAILLSLALKEEGASVSRHMSEARRQLFFPELEQLLLEMKEKKLAYWREEALPLFLWETHMAFCQTITQEACSFLKQGELSPAYCLKLLHASRFQWERLLDIPFGSIRIINATELMSVLNEAFKYIELFLPPGQNEFQTEMPGFTKTRRV